MYPLKKILLDHTLVRLDQSEHKKDYLTNVGQTASPVDKELSANQQWLKTRDIYNQYSNYS